MTNNNFKQFNNQQIIARRPFWFMDMNHEEPIEAGLILKRKY